MQRLCLILIALLGVVPVVGCAVNKQTDPLAAARQMWNARAEYEIEVDAKPAEEPKLQPMTHFSAGRLLETQGRCSQAVEQYRKAVELNPEFSAAHNRLGLCYMKLGQHAEAVEALRKAVALQPEAAWLQNNLGFAWLARQQYGLAEECFQKALLVQPSFLRARMNLAVTLVHQQRDAEALGHLLSLAPEQVAWYNLGTMQLGGGRPAEAHASFEKALSLQPAFPAAQRGLELAAARVAATTAPPVPAVGPTVETAAAAPATQPAAMGMQVAVASPVQGPAIGVEAAAPAPAAGATLAVGGPVATRPAVAVAEPQPEHTLVAGPATQPAVAEAAELQPEPAAVPVAIDADALAAAAATVAAAQAWLDGWSDCVAVLERRALTLDPSLAEAPAAADPSASVEAQADEAMRRLADYVTGLMGRHRPKIEPLVDLADVVDLTSLRWATWTESIDMLYTDVAEWALVEQADFLNIWMAALNELQFQVTGWSMDWATASVD